MHRMYGALLVFVFVLSVSGQINWSTIDSTTLGRLPPASFANITADQLSSIPSDACSGFTSAQTAALNVAAAPGFNNSDCVSNLQSSACGGFTASFIQGVPPVAFTGFSSLCIGRAQNDAFSLINASQLGNISSDSISGLTKLQISNLPAESGAGWTADLLSSLTSSSVCGGFTPAHVAYMPAPAFSGWPSSCVGALAANAWSQISATQLSFIDSDIAGGMTKGLISYLPSAAGAGWSSTTLGGVTDYSASSGCAGFQPAHIAAMNASTFTGWSSSCVSILDNTAWSMISAEQLGYLTADAAYGLTNQVVANMAPASGAGWTVTNLAGVRSISASSGCAGFQPLHVSYIQPPVFAGWQSTCVQLLPNNAWSNITAAQLYYLTPDAAYGLSSQVVAGIAPEAGAGWNAANLAGVRSISGASGCAGFAPQHVAYMTPAAFNGWQSTCVQLLPNNAWSLTNAAQIANLTSDAAYGLSSGVVANMAPEAGAGWTADNLAGVRSISSASGCAGFQPLHVSYMQPPAFAGWQATCVQLLPSNAWSNTSAAQIYFLTADGAYGLSAGVVGNMPGISGAGWTSTNLNGVRSISSASGCANFTSDQVGNMTAAAFAGWDSTCVKLLPATAFSQTNANQIANFSTDGAFGMTKQLVYNMPPAAAAGWTASLLSNISDYSPNSGCAGFTNAQINAIPLAVFPGWTGTCVGLFDPSLFAQFTSPQMNAFPIYAYEGFTAAQVPMIPDAVMLAIPLTLFTNLSSLGFAGLTPHQLQIRIAQDGTTFTNMATPYLVNSYANYNITPILQFKAMIPATIPYLYKTVPTVNCTWLQLALTEAVAIDAATANHNFNYGTLMGITTAQAPLLSKDFIDLIVACDACAGYILPDTMGALTCDQLSWLSGAMGYFRTSSLTVFNTNAQACPNQISTATSAGATASHAASTATAANTLGQSFSISNTVTSSSSHSGKPSNGLSGGEIGGIIAGAIVAVGVIGAIVFFVMRRRRSDYAPLA